VPIAWLLAEAADLGPVGIFMAVPISFSVLAIWSGVLFRRGRWKEQKV
jgi:Na+-driven multidrug efflux pump